MNVGQLKKVLEGIPDETAVLIFSVDDYAERLLADASHEKMDPFQAILPIGRVDPDSIPCVVLWPGD